MLSALQKRLLVWRGCSRARARACSPVTILPRVDAREAGLDGEHAGLVGDGETRIVDLDGEGAHVLALRCRRGT